MLSLHLPTLSLRESLPWSRPPPILPPDCHERVEEILREVIDFSGDGVSRRFLVRWQGRPSEDDAWILEADLDQLRIDLLEPLPSPLANSSESSSFDSGEDWWQARPISISSGDTGSPSPAWSTHEDEGARLLVHDLAIETTSTSMTMMSSHSPYSFLSLDYWASHLCVSGLTNVRPNNPRKEKNKVSVRSIRLADSLKCLCVFVFFFFPFLGLCGSLFRKPT